MVQLCWQPARRRERSRCTRARRGAFPSSSWRLAPRQPAEGPDVDKTSDKRSTGGLDVDGLLTNVEKVDYLLVSTSNLSKFSIVFILQDVAELLIEDSIRFIIFTPHLQPRVSSHSSWPPASFGRRSEAQPPAGALCSAGPRQPRFGPQLAALCGCPAGRLAVSNV